MKHILFILFASIANLCTAQDDHPDFRSKRDVFAHITEKDIRSDLASFSMGGIDESVGKLPLKTVPVASVGNNFITFSGNNINVKITSAPFDPKKHKLGYYDKFLVKIDNKPYYGDYGKIPTSSIESVSVIINQDTVNIPQTAFFDLYNPIFYTKEGGVQKTANKVYLSADGRKIYVYMLKREEGGSYEVTWIIQDKKYLKRVVDFGFLK